MEGQKYVDWDGKTRSYSPQPDNYKDFFEVGNTYTNSFALDGGNADANFRLSYTNLKNEGISPNSEYNRNTINLRCASKITEKINADIKVSYINQHALNRLNQSDGRGAGRNYNFMPRNISDESLKDYKNAAGEEKVWYTPWAWQSNPYWVAYENKNEDWRDRVLGVISLNYKISKWLSVRAKTGMDFYDERRQNRLATGSFAKPVGDFYDVWIGFKESNSSILFNANKKINKNIEISGNLGGSRMKRKYEQSSSKVDRLAVPNFYHPEFGEDDAEVGYDLSEKQINSIYGSAQLAYKSYLYFDFTARNDWSSTLPAENNSYFYPSVNIGFVFTEAFKFENKILSFGKLRASWAQVGSDADPYMLQQTYASNGNFNGNPMVMLNSTLPLSNLKPEITNSIEAGTDLRFFLDRIGIDFTYYHSNTKNQIVPADISSASGFSKAVINAGEIENKGIELMLKLLPLKKKNLRWEANLNYSRNKSEVISLTEGLDNYQLGSQWGVTIEARPGNPYGDIVGVSIARDGNGNKIINADGSYVKGDRKVLGNYNPDWLCGINNTVTYKKISLNFLIDVRKGGQIYSASNMYAHGYSGTVDQTLEGREEWYQSEKEREAAGVSPQDWIATAGYLAGGVYAQGTVIDGVDVSGQSNTIYMNPELYWGQFSEWGNELHEPHVYDADYVKLRELSISYTLPKKMISKLHIESLKLSLVGRNLWLIYSAVPNIDPEASYNNGNGQGVEYGAYPVSRSFGFNISMNI